MKMNTIFISLLITGPAWAQEQGEPPGDDEIAEDIVVTGTRTPRRLGDAPVAVEVIDRDDIEASGAEDMADVLDQQPGVQIDRGLFGSSVRLRGMDPKHVLVLVDGQRIAGRKDGTIDLSRIPLDAIERIEIVKGAASALYGADAIGGVINIITRRAKRPVEGSLHARGGTLGTLDTSAGLGLRSERSGLRFDAGWHGSAAYDLDPTTVDTDGNAIEQLDLTLSTDHSPNPDLTLRVLGSYALQDAQGVDPAPNDGAIDRRNVTEDALGRFTLDWLFDERSRWSNSVGASIFRDQFLNDQRNAGELDNYEETRENLLQLSTQLDRVTGPHVLSVGAEGYLSDLTSPRIEDGAQANQRGGVYLQDELRLSEAPRLVLLLGARVDGNSQFGVAPAPRLGLRLDPVEQLTLRANLSSGWRAPTLREQYLAFANPSAGYTVRGNPDLVPERSLGGSVGVEWVPAEVFSISISGWYERFRNLIQVGTIEEGPTIEFGYLNIARSRTLGAEAGLSLEPSQWVGLDLGGSLIDAIDLDTGDPLEGQARLQGTSTLRLALPVRHGPRLNARARVVGSQPFYADIAGGQVDVVGSGERTDADPYALIDLRLSQPLAPRKQLSLFAGVENLLDAGNPTYQPVSPRLLYAGLDAKLAGRQRTPGSPP